MRAPFARLAPRAGDVPSTSPFATPVPATLLVFDRQPALPTLIFAAAGVRPRTLGTVHRLGTVTRSVATADRAPAFAVAVHVSRLPRSALAILYVRALRPATV